MDILRKGRKQLLQIAVMSVLLFALILGVAACGGQEAQGSEKTTTTTIKVSSNNNTTTTSKVDNRKNVQWPVKATWITPEVSGGSVSIPVAEVENNTIVHFKVADSRGSELAFMAYDVGGQLNIRANVCPPCRSIGFSLDKDTLICDSCRTTFEAKTGEGIAGACVAFPKAQVMYEIENGKAVMNTGDMITAYQNTVESGLP
ncbi:Fe-S-containing protein [Chloroflexota bacterium]